jgi:hypothetical protein
MHARALLVATAIWNRRRPTLQTKKLARVTVRPLMFLGGCGLRFMQRHRTVRSRRKSVVTRGYPLDHEVMLFAGGDHYPSPGAEMHALRARRKLAATSDMLPLAIHSGNTVRPISGIELIAALHEIFDRDDARLKRVGFLCPALQCG